MKKSTQKEVQTMANVITEAIIDAVNTELKEEGLRNVHRLRSCSAEVGETSDFYVLRSYSTIIAVIEKDTDILYDFLRYVYGYTATSAQHISKFSHDYGAGKWGCAHRYTWRKI